MRIRPIHSTALLIAAACGLDICMSYAAAQEQSVLVPPQVTPPTPPQVTPATPPQVTLPNPLPAMPSPEPPQLHETMPPQNSPSAVVVSEPAVHPAPPIVTHASLSARRMYRCHEEVSLVMATMDPVTCCVYEIPLCVPACCTGAPTISSRSGLLGRGVVEYCWPCGFSAKVKFRHVLGDVKVEYDG